LCRIRHAVATVGTFADARPCAASWAFARDAGSRRPHRRIMKRRRFGCSRPALTTVVDENPRRFAGRAGAQQAAAPKRNKSV